MHYTYAGFANQDLMLTILGAMLQTAKDVDHNNDPVITDNDFNEGVSSFEFLPTQKSISISLSQN